MKVEITIKKVNLTKAIINQLPFYNYQTFPPIARILGHLRNVKKDISRVALIELDDGTYCLACLEYTDESLVWTRGIRGKRWTSYLCNASSDTEEFKKCQLVYRRIKTQALEQQLFV